jgi:2-phospho-L-lactate/phosphoenolpyruvate guanylyltransferase
VPVRGLGVSKSRLGEALDAEERRTLVVGLLLETLSVLTAWEAVDRVHVITGDLILRRLVRNSSAGVRVASETTGSGLNGALGEGRQRALAHGATAVLYLPADLPHLTFDALDGLLEAADAAVAAGSGKPVVVIAPSEARSGTNAMLVSPPTTIDPHFGEDSLRAHVRAAASADASLQLVNDPQLGFDLDTPEDLERLEADRLVALEVLGQRALDSVSSVPRAEVA